jgi:hypothetical protein
MRKPIAEKQDESFQGSFMDPFKERLLNPFIFSLLIAFISRYRVELYDLFVYSSATSNQFLLSLKLFDLELWWTVAVVIFLYLSSVFLGNLVVYTKEAIKRWTDSKFAQIVPISKQEYLLVVEENKSLQYDLRDQRNVVVSSASHLGKVIIDILKVPNTNLQNLSLFMPQYMETATTVPFVYSQDHLTRVFYSLFDLPNNTLSVCFPIQKSEVGHLICVRFRISGTNFIFSVNDRQVTSEVIQIPTQFINAFHWQSWAQPHYFDESSSTWTTFPPGSRSRFLGVHLSPDQTTLNVRIFKRADIYGP